MTVQFGLNIVTLVMCIITLTMATAALMPQIKLGLVILRDGVLWALLLGVVGFVGFVGWTRLHEKRLNRVPSFAPTTTIENGSDGSNRGDLFSFLGEEEEVPEYRPALPLETRRSSYRPAESSDVDRDHKSLDVSISPERNFNSRITPNRSGRLAAPSPNSRLQPVFYDNRYRGN